MTSNDDLRMLTACLLVMIGIVSFTVPAFARHGEETILTNRIPEPAPYVVSETTQGGGAFAPPPFESLWKGDNDVGSCSGCHTELFDQWNGAMMSNAWRDPGWRGAFLLVARATSTDGNCDTPQPPDGTQKASLNPFSHPTDCQSTFNTGTSTATYTGSGSLMDDFCSRCHMPTNYIDATTSVITDTPSGMEHGRISPSYDPTACVGSAPECYPGSVSTRDPYTGVLTAESFDERMDGPRAVNSNSGKLGIVCEVCHANVETRYTPYHNYNKSGTEYYPAPKNASRLNQGLSNNQEDMLTVPDAASRNLGYAVGAGAFRLSPHALNWPDRFGPLTENNFSSTLDAYVSDVFTGGTRTTNVYFTRANTPWVHDTYYQVKFERAEFCAACHDVTNPMTIKNQYGYWVGGFPIERTYTEYNNSRYADRPGNTAYDANYKRDCQTCHMQQTYGEPGTALTLYTVNGSTVTPDAPILEPSCDMITHNPGYSHHFVGANGYMTRIIGADSDSNGTVKPYPELLHTSFSSADPDSRFHFARYDTTGTITGGTTQHERFAWDRLRNALTMTLTAPTSVTRPSSETLAALTIAVKNEGSGHNFPTGFPEGRAAWVYVKAWDTKNTASTTDDVELMIQDSANGNRRSLGVGNLTSTAMVDPNYPATCPDTEGHPTGWKIPEGSIDPYAVVFRAVATLDKICPTLDLAYATPVNLIVNANNQPIDSAGQVIDRNNPAGLPRYADLDGDGDLFDDSYLRDTRLRPMPHAGATLNLSRYSVVVPSTIVGPIGVSAIVYYQSFEGIVAKKFLGNLANTDDLDANEGFPGGTPTLEPCVLKGPCDRIGKAGATGETQLRTALLFDPIAVEGSPPAQAEVKNAVIQVSGTADTVAPRLVINNWKANPNTTATIPANRHWSPSPYGGPTGNYASEGYGETNVAHQRIVKVTFSEPVTGVDANTFYLIDSGGRVVQFLIDQIDDTTWALFPSIKESETKWWRTYWDTTGYVIHIAPSRNGSAIRDFAGNQLAAGPASGGEYTFGFKSK